MREITIECIVPFMSLTAAPLSSHRDDHIHTCTYSPAFMHILYTPMHAHVHEQTDSHTQGGQKTRTETWPNSLQPNPGLILYV
jgi:hypothetical protein